MLTQSQHQSYTTARIDTVHSSANYWSVMKMSGDDRVAFLQGQTSNDIKKLAVGDSLLTSFLTVKGRIKALAHVFKTESELYILLERDLIDEIAEHLERYIIMEDVTIEKITELNAHLISGPNSFAKLSELKLISEKKSALQIEPSAIVDLAFEVTFTGDNGYLLFSSNNIEDHLQELERVDSKVLDLLLDEGAFLRNGRDVDSKILLPETGLQARCVSYDKGCFVGQEIVARVKSRGTVNRSLLAIAFADENALPEAKSTLLFRGKKGAEITHVFYSPFAQAHIAFAYLNKACRCPGETYVFTTEDGRDIKGTLKLLPLYQTEARKNKAQALFDEAMVYFVKDDEGESQAADLLRKAIHLDPQFADAYESLGVILSRQERFDEAIELMKHLREISPEEVMAATNLSIFYMKKGMIQEAEDEKTQATMLQFKKAAKERKQRLAQEADLKSQREELERRREMFHAVIEIDEDDLVANFGLGKLALDENRFAAAAEHFERCIKTKKDYSVAFLHLGTAYQKLNEKEKAIETFRHGIEVATVTGDMMPQKEMERNLMSLVMNKD